VLESTYATHVSQARWPPTSSPRSPATRTPFLDLLNTDVSPPGSPVLSGGSPGSPRTPAYLRSPTAKAEEKLQLLGYPIRGPDRGACAGADGDFDLGGGGWRAEGEDGAVESALGLFPDDVAVNLLGLLAR
jgi:hypothetical protein